VKRDVTLVWGYTDKKDERWKEGMIRIIVATVTTIV